MTAHDERLVAVVAPILDDLGVELVDLEHAGGVVRVVADRDGGIDLATLGRATRAVSAALDETDPIPGRYTLEVSSPGLERPLRKPAHFARAIGSDVKVKTTPDHEGERRLAGALVAADDEGFELLLGDGSRRRLGYDDVVSVRTVFEWGPGPKPGSRADEREAAKP